MSLIELVALAYERARSEVAPLDSRDERRVTMLADDLVEIALDCDEASREASWCFVIENHSSGSSRFGF